MAAFVSKINKFQKRLFRFSNFLGASIWMIVKCNGCPIVLDNSSLCEYNKAKHYTSQLFKMTAPGKFWKTKTSVFEVCLFLIQTLPLENDWTSLIVNIMLNILQLNSCFSVGSPQATTTATATRMSSQNINSRYCNHFKTIPSFLICQRCARQSLRNETIMSGA